MNYFNVTIYSKILILIIIFNEILFKSTNIYIYIYIYIYRERERERERE